MDSVLVFDYIKGVVTRLSLKAGDPLGRQLKTLVSTGAFGSPPPRQVA